MLTLPTTKKIRSVIADCKTEKDIELSLRYHKIRYTFTTETGYFSVRIPCRKGIIRIYKTCSRSAPFMIRHEKPVPAWSPVPVYHNEY